MNTFDTTLTTSGNSVAVRLPKVLLKMSGLGNNVRLEAKQGKIIISKSTDSRAGWEAQFKALKSSGDDLSSDDFVDMESASGDGLDDLPWNGISYQEWLKKNAKKH